MFGSVNGNHVAAYEQWQQNSTHTAPVPDTRGDGRKCGGVALLYPGLRAGA